MTNPSQIEIYGNWGNIYRQLAENLNDAVQYPPYAVDYTYHCLIIILGTTSSDDNGTTITTSFFRTFYDLYVYSKKFTYLDSQIKKVLMKMNDFTIANYNSDLTEFVNSLEWTDGCIPYYWGTFCREMNYDVTGWTICIS